MLYWIKHLWTENQCDGNISNASLLILVTAIQFHFSTIFLQGFNHKRVFDMEGNIRRVLVNSENFLFSFLVLEIWYVFPIACHFMEKSKSNLWKWKMVKSSENSKCNEHFHGSSSDFEQVFNISIMVMWIKHCTKDPMGMKRLGIW